MRRGNKTAGICLLLLLFLVPAAIYGCGQKKEVHLFHAQIMEIRDRTMLVRPAEGSEERKSADAFLVEIVPMNPSPEPGEGDWVEITYDGGITETYPAGLDHVISIVIVDAGRMDQTESGPDEDGEDPLRNGEGERVSVTGSFGEISAEIPVGWKAEVYREGQEGLTYGLYGLSLEPEDDVSGRIELVATDSFGVCGTGLKTEEIFLAGGRARMGTYDDHAHWDFITFGDGDLKGAGGQAVALHTDCSSWEERHWEEAMSILNTAAFDLSVAEAGSAGKENPKEE